MNRRFIAEYHFGCVSKKTPSFFEASKSKEKKRNRRKVRKETQKKKWRRLNISKIPPDQQKEREKKTNVDDAMHIHSSIHSTERNRITLYHLCHCAAHNLFVPIYRSTKETQNVSRCSSEQKNIFAIRLWERVEIWPLHFSMTYWG